MKTGYDINQLKGDGYLILPLSMSRLAHGSGQDPEQIYKVIKHFTQKIESYSNDMVLLYTIGNYFNNDGVDSATRTRLVQQMINHSRSLQNLIEKKREYIPSAFHYITFDSIILNSPKYHTYFHLIKKAEREDINFRAALEKDLNGRAYTEANINFLLEEIVMAHMLRQHMVKLPRTLVSRDIWRLIAYPGSYINGDWYQWKNKILPQTDLVNPYAGGQYDLENNVFNNFADIEK